MDVFIKSELKWNKWHLLPFFGKLYIFLKCSTSSQVADFRIHLICMKIGLSEVVLYVFVFCTLLFPSRGGEKRALG